MTALLYNFQDNPRYQRLVRKMASMGQHQRAIFDTALADRTFANEAMQKRLALLRMQADEISRQGALELGERRLGLGKRALGLRKSEWEAKRALTEEGRDFEKKQRRFGTLAAAVNVPIAGYFGYKGMQRDIQEAEANEAFRKKILGLIGGR